jgi:hypothetical protein
MTGKVTLRNKPTKPVGEIVSSEIPELVFQTGGRKSLFADLLTQLDDAPKGSVLKVNCLKSRASISVQARKLGFKVQFAESDGQLYCRIVAYADEKKATPGASPAPMAASMAVILDALRMGPLTLKEIARKVGATPAQCDAPLRALVERKSIEHEDGVYRLLGAAGAKVRG